MFILFKFFISMFRIFSTPRIALIDHLWAIIYLSDMNHHSRQVLSNFGTIPELSEQCWFSVQILHIFVPNFQYTQNTIYRQCRCRKPIKTTWTIRKHSRHVLSNLRRFHNFTEIFLFLFILFIWGSWQILFILETWMLTIVQISTKGVRGDYYINNFQP